MSSPAACDRYQSAVHATDSAIPSLERHPRERSASAEDNVRACASEGCTALSRSHPGLPAKRALKASTTSCTLQKDAVSGPKLTARGAVSAACTNACASVRYPESGSSTCCHGLTASG